MPVSDHRQRVVRQKGMDFTLETYRLSRQSPREETCGLTSQFGLQYIINEELAEFRELLVPVGRMLTRLLKRLGA